MNLPFALLTVAAVLMLVTASIYKGIWPFKKTQETTPLSGITKAEHERQLAGLDEQHKNELKRERDQHSSNEKGLLELKEQHRQRAEALQRELEKKTKEATEEHDRLVSCALDSAHRQRELTTAISQVTQLQTALEQARLKIPREIGGVTLFGPL
ncbi:MAG: hypothetical protein ACLPPV_21040, partial [Candidatus Korobacteraceae bacterium]